MRVSNLDLEKCFCSCFSTETRRLPAGVAHSYRGMCRVSLGLWQSREVNGREWKSPGWSLWKMYLVQLVQLYCGPLCRRDESHSIHPRKLLQRQHQDVFLRVASKIDTEMSSARSVLCSHPCITPSLEGSVAKDVRCLIRDVFKCEKHCLLKILSLYVSQLVIQRPK